MVKMDRKYQETFDTWNKVAQLYESKFMDLDLYNDTYDFFCDSLKNDHAAILELGCGPGNITQYLLSQKPNVRITAIDISENMITLAKKNNPNAQFQVMDCRDISKIQNRFDAIICGFTIPYLSKTDCSKLINDCHNLLEKNGNLYLSFVAGDYQISGFISGRTGNRTYFYYHDLRQIKDELQKNSFTIQNLSEKKHPKPDGSHEIHTVINARLSI
jgi:ubiquinone/menaquinone biosynthesis C-methylase UbiE